MKRLTLTSLILVGAMSLVLLFAATAFAGTNVPAWWIDHGTQSQTVSGGQAAGARTAVVPGREYFYVHLWVRDANSGIAIPGVQYRMLTWQPPIYTSWTTGDEVQLWVDRLTAGTDGEFPLDYRAYDRAGNLSQATVPVRIDTRAPSTDGASGWVNGTVPYVLTAVDQVPGSGVAATVYRVDQKTPWSVNAPATVAPALQTKITWTNTTQGALHTVDFASVDAALPFDYVASPGTPSWHYGNWELDVLSLVSQTGAYRSRAVQLDITAPTATVSGADDAWHSSPVTLAFSASDVGSGVNHIEWTYDGANWTTGTSVTVSRNGATTVSYRAVDNVGLVSATQTVTVKVSTSPPVVTGGGNVAVRQGKKASFAFNVAANTPTCKVTIEIRSRDGRTLMTKNFVNVPTGSDQTRHFRIPLKPGRYDIRIGATDLAGQVQVPRATGTLTVS
jgi:hypothetical protein